MSSKKGRQTTLFQFVNVVERKPDPSECQDPFFLTVQAIYRYYNLKFPMSAIVQVIHECAGDVSEAVFAVSRMGKAPASGDLRARLARGEHVDMIRYFSTFSS